MTYKLSNAGRALAWRDYEAYGYGLSHLAVWNLSKAFGPIAHWSLADLTLGQIEDSCAAAGREIAYNFVHILNLPNLATPR